MILDGPLVLPHKHKMVAWRRGFPLRLCKCGFVDGVRPKVGSNTIDVGAAGAGDIARWSGSAAALAAGDLGMSALTSESSNGRPRAFIEGESKDLVGCHKFKGNGRSRFLICQQDASLTTLSTLGGAAPGTVGTATVVNTSGGEGQHIQYASGAVANNEGGLVSTFDQTRRNRNPVFDDAMRTAATASLAVQRTWIGLFSADPMASDTPAVHLAAFRYSPATDTTAFWRCVTDNGSGTPTVTTTTQSIGSTTSYRLRIVCDAGGSAIRFYINGILYATHTATLPTSTQDLGYVHKVRTLEAVAKSIRFGRICILQKAAS